MAVRLLVVTVLRAAAGSRGAGMPRYAQLVMGPAGSGKVRTWREKEGKAELVGGREVLVLRGSVCALWTQSLWAARFCRLGFRAVFVVLKRVEG